MFSVTSNAYENTIEEFTDTEPEYISISHTNLLSNESETINISTKDMGNPLPTYTPETNRTIIGMPNNNIFSTYAIIGPTDDRALVSDTTKYPFSAIAYMLTTCKNGHPSYRNCIYD